MTDEIWKIVAELDGRYEVSNFGCVRSFLKWRSGKISTDPQRYITAFLVGPKSKRYLQVKLRDGNVYVARYIHVLVARAFLGPKPEGLTVNHKNGIRSDCHESNLEYMTRSENQKHAYRIGLQRRPTKPRRRLLPAVPL
jgi:hypothetical protein